MRKSIWVLFLFFNSMWTYSQPAVKKLDEGFSGHSKPIVLYFHTDWCSYCAIQSAQLKKDTSISQMLNESFYFIDFNAESLGQIIFNDYTFRGTKNSTHEFAKSFFPNSRQIAYPAWVILNKNYQLIFSHQGLIKLDKLKEILSLIPK